MRFVDWNPVDDEEASPATAPEIASDGLMRDDVFALWFPEAERMMQQAEKYFPQLRAKVSNQKEVLAPPRVQPLHTRKQISAPNANKGLSSPCR
jgi:hypothetical protein